MEYFEKTQLRSIYNRIDGFPRFLNIFFMCWVKHLVY